MYCHTGPYGDKAFAKRLLNIGSEYYMEAYRRYFTQATARELEYYYVYVSAGVMGLLEKWLADGMTASPRRNGGYGGEDDGVWSRIFETG